MGHDLPWPLPFLRLPMEKTVFLSLGSDVLRLSICLCCLFNSFNFYSTLVGN